MSFTLSSRGIVIFYRFTLNLYTYTTNAMAEFHRYNILIYNIYTCFQFLVHLETISTETLERSKLSVVINVRWYVVFAQSYRAPFINLPVIVRKMRMAGRGRRTGLKPDVPISCLGGPRRACQQRSINMSPMLAISNRNIYPRCSLWCMLASVTPYQALRQAITCLRNVTNFPEQSACRIPSGHK